jgi:hypothetical protein
MNRLLSLLAAVALASPVGAQESEFTWHTNELNQIVLDSFSGASDAYMPSNIEGLPVVAFGTIFSGVPSMQSMTLSTNVTEIPAYAFAGCEDLWSVTLPPNVHTIGDNAFADADLETILFPASLRAVGNSAFWNTELTTLTVPASVTNWGSAVFQNCLALANVSFEEGCTVVPDSMLTDCTALTSVSLATTITQIESGGFMACTNLTAIAIPPAVESIGFFAFAYSGLETVEFQTGSLTSIAEGAFAYCAALTSVTLPDGLQVIGDSAFQDSGLAQVPLVPSIRFYGSFNPPAVIESQQLRIPAPEDVASGVTYGLSESMSGTLVPTTNITGGINGSSILGMP